MTGAMRCYEREYTKKIGGAGGEKRKMGRERQDRQARFLLCLPVGSSHSAKPNPKAEAEPTLPTPLHQSVNNGQLSPAMRGIRVLPGVPDVVELGNVLLLHCV